MKKNLGGTQFEFYFVISVIGLIVLVGIQRYSMLAQETRRFSFEIVARNFNAVVHNYHARWITAQQKSRVSQLNIDGMTIQFSPKGWPLAALTAQQVVTEVSTEASVKTCLSLWQNFLENPPAISYAGGDAYGTDFYHLSVPNANTCRFEFIVPHSTAFYFEYAPFSTDAIFYFYPSY